MNAVQPEVGEILLLMIGVLMSISLVVMFFIPFVARLRVRRWAKVSGLSLEAGVEAVVGRLRRLDYVPFDGPEEADEAAEVPGVHRVYLRRAPNSFSIRFTAIEGEAGPCFDLHIVQDGLTKADFKQMTVLTGTALGFLSARVHRALIRAGGRPAWRLRARPDAPTRAKPFPGVFRPFIDLSPWH